MGGRGALLPERETDSIKPKDLILYERAIRQQWEIPQNLYADLPMLAAEIIARRDANKNFLYTDRSRLAAIRLILAMHTANQRDDPAVQKHEHEHTHRLTLDERRTRLLDHLGEPGEDGGTNP